MLVNGGRSGWAWIASFASLGGLGLFSTLGVGCGSRTSMLDPDVYGVGSENVGSGGTNNVRPAPSGSAGTKPTGGGLLGDGGSTSSSGNKGGASGVDPGLALSPCQQYCPGYGAQCQKRLKGQDCMPTCQGELNGYGSTCQALGIQTLNCLAPFFSPNGGACDPAVNRALTMCSGIVTAFENCKEGTTTGPKMPTPTPTPTPKPKPTGDIGSCASMGSGGPGEDCKMVFSCANGLYETHCEVFQGDKADCTCVSPNGTQIMTRVARSMSMCLDAAFFCQ